MRITLFVLSILTVYNLCAQDIPGNPNVTDEDGLRQGKWTIYYDGGWKAIDGPEYAQYYRLIEFKDDKPIGIVRDYYRSGVVQMEATLIQDKPKAKYDGVAKFYRRDGSLESTQTYDKGRYIKRVRYDRNGQVIVNWFSYNGDGILAYRAGNYKQAIQHFEKALPLAESTFGKNHHNYSTTLNNLAVLNNLLNRFEQAEPYFLESIKVSEQLYGKDSRKRITTVNNLAQMYYKIGQYDKAIPLFNEALAVKARTEGKNTDNYAITVTDLGRLKNSQGFYDESEAYYQEALAIRKNLADHENVNYANNLTLLAHLYKNRGRLAEAEKLYLEGLAIQEKAVGKEHPNYANTLASLGGLFKTMGDLKKSEEFYLKAQDIRQTAFGTTEHSHYANGLFDLGRLYKSLGQYERAIEHYEEGLKIRLAVLGSEHPSYLTGLMNIASLHETQGLYKKAHNIYTYVLAERKRIFGEKHPSYSHTLHALSDYYKAVADYAKAEKLANQTLKIKESTFGKEHPHYINALMLLGSIYDLQDRFPEAEEMHLQALHLRGKLYGKTSPSYAGALSAISGHYHRQGLYDKQEKAIREALEISTNKYGKLHPSTVTHINNLAVSLDEQERKEEAEELYRESLELREKLYGKENLNYATSLNNLAFLLRETGRLDEAYETQLQVIEIRKGILRPDHPANARALNDMGNIYHAKKEFDKAENLYKETLNIIEKQVSENSTLLAKYTYDLAELYADKGAYDLSISPFLKARDIYLNEIDRNFSNLSENEKGQYFKKISKTFNEFHELAWHYGAIDGSVIAEDYNNILATKGLLFQSSRKILRTIKASGDTSLMKLYDDWRLQKNYLSTLYELSSQERENAGIDIDQERNKANDLEKELSQQSTLFAAATTQKRYDWKDVQKALKPEEAAIEIIRANLSSIDKPDSVVYLAYLVKGDSKSSPSIVRMPDGTMMEGKAFKNYRNSVKFKLDDTMSYQTFWAPLKAELTGIDKVYLSADGIYHSISLSGLWDEEDQSFLADQMRLIRVSSTKDIVVAKRKRIPKEIVELLGYPIYDLELDHENKPGDFRSLKSIVNDSSSRFFDGNSIPLLPGTKREVENMKSIFSKGKIPVNTYLEESSTETVVKNWDNPKIAHIATHGFFLKDKDIERREGQIAGMERKSFEQNPLLRSGLLFSNAKQAIESGGEGILTAFEASLLNLDETELVVLSACETGLGEIKNGEGVYGLQRAFMSAGAASIIMSLWTVSDQATQELMTYFYENWLIKNYDKRTAFNKAKLSLREKYNHPYYWAAFVMLGE